MAAQDASRPRPSRSIVAGDLVFEDLLVAHTRREGCSVRAKIGSDAESPSGLSRVPSRTCACLRHGWERVHRMWLHARRAPVFIDDTPQRRTIVSATLRVTHEIGFGLELGGAGSRSRSTATPSARSTTTRRWRLSSNPDDTPYEYERADTRAKSTPSMQPTAMSSASAATGPGSGPGTSRPSSCRALPSRSSANSNRPRTTQGRTASRRLLGVPLEEADTDQPAEHDVAGAGHERPPIGAVPAAEVEHPGQEPHDVADR